MIDVAEYQRQIQATVARLEPLTPDEMLVFLHAMSELADLAYEQVQAGMAREGGDTAFALESIEQDIVRFKARLYVYYMEVLGCKALDARCHLPAVKDAVFRGIFHKNWMASSQPPLCYPGQQCVKSVPDVVKPMMFLNQIHSFTGPEGSSITNTENLWKDVKRSTVERVYEDMDGASDQEVDEAFRAIGGRVYDGAKKVLDTTLTIHKRSGLYLALAGGVGLAVYFAIKRR